MCRRREPENTSTPEQEFRLFRTVNSTTLHATARGVINVRVDVPGSDRSDSPGRADTLTVYGVLLNPVCQEELYDPGRNVSIKPNQILRHPNSLKVRFSPFRAVPPTCPRIQTGRRIS